MIKSHCEFAPFPFPEHEQWGYLDRRQVWAIPPQFENADCFAENGLAATSENGQWGFIDREGNWQISPAYDDARQFENNGLAAVKLDGLWGFIDAQGQWQIPAQYDSAYSFYDQPIAIVSSNQHYGAINEQGQWIIPPDFDFLGGLFLYQPLSEASKGPQKFFVNIQGDIVLTVGRLCDTEILLNAQGQRVWPETSTAEICAEAQKLRNRD